MKKSGIVTPFGGEYESTATPVPPSVETAAEPPLVDAVTAHQSVLDEWEVPEGIILVVRDRYERDEKGGEDLAIVSTVETVSGGTKAIYAPGERTELLEAFEPWATVLMVGPPKVTDHGVTIYPPKVKPGQRVLINATAAHDIDIPVEGGGKFRVTKIGFGSIALIKKMRDEPVSAEGAPV
jgi:co-chaperonin GroES (HSP10)